MAVAALQPSVGGHVGVGQNWIELLLSFLGWAGTTAELLTAESFAGLRAANHRSESSLRIIAQNHRSATLLSDVECENSAFDCPICLSCHWQ